MSRLEIAIVDYQMGNLRSVQKALERVGSEGTITNDPNQIAEARKVILPGVGAFGDAMRELNARGLPAPIVDSIRSGKPFLGICLGLQLLFEIGYEGDSHHGLGVLKGDVVKFAGSEDRKVPHMGWNRIHEEKGPCPLLQDVASDAYFYFVHSYYVRPKDTENTWLNCDYGQPFCAAVWKDNLFATQFHPEKSQRDGLKLLENFAKL
jgi:imidazole glycerol-phosphate synthase subunit HisH